ncbi:MAG TPA: prepilin peptidase [Xanthobacteraceae bacterium]
MVLQLMILGLFPAAMAFAAASDLVSMAISNRLSIALLLGFFVMAAMIGMPLADVGRHVMACLLVLAVAFVFFALGWIGGGDAKLAAATALWIGFPLLLEYTLVAAIFGGMLTLMLLQLKRFPLPLPLASQPWITRLHTLENGIPYGIALAAAGLAVYPETPFMRALAA